MVVELRHVPVSRYSNLLGWELRDPLRKLLSVGSIEPKATGKVSFTPEADGVYLLAVSAGRCAYCLVRSNTAVGLYAGPGHPLSVIGGAKRLYFYVPARTKRFTVTAKGHGQETVRVDVFGPTSRKVNDRPDHAPPRVREGPRRGRRTRRCHLVADADSGAEGRAGRRLGRPRRPASAGGVHDARGRVPVGGKRGTGSVRARWSWMAMRRCPARQC